MECILKEIISEDGKVLNLEGMILRIVIELMEVGVFNVFCRGFVRLLISISNLVNFIILNLNFNKFI